MKKTKIKGYSAFALLSELDDDMIAAAALPEVPAATAVQNSRKSAPHTVSRFMRTAWAAVIPTVAVSLVILVALVTIGRNGGFAPPAAEAVPDGTMAGLNGSPADSDDLMAGEDNTPMDPMAPGESEGINPGGTPEEDDGPVAVISDGFTVYPKGYCVWMSGQQPDKNGEMTSFDADGLGAVNQLGAIKNEIPYMFTSGNHFSLSLSDGMTLRSIRVFEVLEIQNDTFAEIALGADGADFSHDPMMYLSVLPQNRNYIVVLEIYYQYESSSGSATGVDEYAFWLTTGSSLDDKAPVRLAHDGHTYMLEEYILQKTYYDVDLGKEVTEDYDGAEKILKRLVKSMQTVTVTRGESLSLYLAPSYGLKTVTVYHGLTLWETYNSDEPLELLHEWPEGDYYFIFTAVYDGADVAEVVEFPIHIQLVDEQIDTENWPGQVHVSDPDARVTLEGTKSTVEFDVCYMLWVEAWYDGVLESGDGLGAEGQIKELVEAEMLNGYYLTHTVNAPLGLHLNGHEPDLVKVTVYDKDLNYVGEASNFTVIHELPAGTYIVIMAIKTQGDYIPEAGVYESSCYEYPFYLELHEK